MLLISKTSMQLKVSRLYELHKAMERRKDWIGTVMAKVSSQSMIIFATPAGEHKCKKEHLEFPKKSVNQWNPKKFYINYDINLCPVQSHIFKTA